jgi:acetyl-CoA carboxylase beta subunit
VAQFHGPSLENTVPYVECPSCTKTSYTAAAYNALELCPHCGAGLPLRRRVVSALAAQARRTSAEQSTTTKPATA